jgi:hypothetical protein
VHPSLFSVNYVHVETRCFHCVSQASLPSQLEREPGSNAATPVPANAVAVSIGAPPQFLTSPPIHPSIRRVTATTLPIALSVKRGICSGTVFRLKKHRHA